MINPPTQDFKKLKIGDGSNLAQLLCERMKTKCWAVDRETRAPFRGATEHFAAPFHARDEQSKGQEKRDERGFSSRRR